MNGDRTTEIGTPVAIFNVFAGVNDQPRPRLPDRNNFHFANAKTRGIGVNSPFSSCCVPADWPARLPGS
jgi:hypothetical protein